MKTVPGCDVLVAGGGVAGAAAAVAAARSGARTVLAEKARTIGGTGVSALLRHVCGLYRTGAALPRSTLNGGIAGEVAARLSHPFGIERMGKVFVLAYSARGLEATLRGLCAGESRLRVLTGAKVVAAHRTKDVIDTVGLRTRGGRIGLRPAAVVDCTGNGEVAALAGARLLPDTGAGDQLSGYTVRLAGVDGGTRLLPVQVAYLMRSAVDRRLLPGSFLFTVFIPGEKSGEGYLKFSVSEPVPGGLPAVKRSVSRAVRLLKKGLPAFRNCRIAGASAGIFPRKAGRILGEYVLTASDVLGARKFPRGGVRNSWPIELWNPVRGPVYRYVGGDGIYEIPPSCQKSRDVRNLFMAGKCISVTDTALGSTRVMGACLALGEAAGRLAAGLRTRCL